MSEDKDLILKIGEIHSDVKSIYRMMEQQQASNNQRFDAVEKRVTALESDSKGHNTKIATFGGIGAGLALAAEHLIKRLGN